jgi:hypothetical protein
MDGCYYGGRKIASLTVIYTICNYIHIAAYKVSENRILQSKAETRSYKL